METHAVTQFGDKLNPNSSLAEAQSRDFVRSRMNYDEFLVHVLNEGGVVNEAWDLGALLNVEDDTDYSRDKINDGIYEFSSGTRLLVISQEGDGRSVEHIRHPREDFNKNGIKEDNPNVILYYRDTPFSIFREQMSPEDVQELKDNDWRAQDRSDGLQDVYHYESAQWRTNTVSVLSERSLDSARARLEHQRLKDLEKYQHIPDLAAFQQRVLSDRGDINQFHELGRVIGAPTDQELSQDATPDKVFTFTSGKKLYLISNYGDQRWEAKSGYTRRDVYLAQQSLWEIKSNKAAWIAEYTQANTRFYGDPYGNGPIIDSPGQPRVIVIPQGPTPQQAEQAWQQQVKAREAQLNRVAEKVDKANWEDINDNWVPETVIGSVKFTSGELKGKTFTLLLEQ